MSHAKSNLIPPILGVSRMHVTEKKSEQCTDLAPQFLPSAAKKAMGGRVAGDDDLPNGKNSLRPRVAFTNGDLVLARVGQANTLKYGISNNQVFYNDGVYYFATVEEQQEEDWYTIRYLGTADITTARYRDLEAATAIETDLFQTLGAAGGFEYIFAEPSDPPLPMAAPAAAAPESDMEMGDQDGAGAAVGAPKSAMELGDQDGAGAAEERPTIAKQLKTFTKPYWELPTKLNTVEFTPIPIPTGNKMRLLLWEEVLDTGDGEGDDDDKLYYTANPFRSYTDDSQFGPAGHIFDKFGAFIMLSDREMAKWKIVKGTQEELENEELAEYKPVVAVRGRSKTRKPRRARRKRSRSARVSVAEGAAEKGPRTNTQADTIYTSMTAAMTAAVGPAGKAKTETQVETNFNEYLKYINRLGSTYREDFKRTLFRCDTILDYTEVGRRVTDTNAKYAKDVARMMAPASLRIKGGNKVKVLENITAYIKAAVGDKSLGNTAAAFRRRHEEKYWPQPKDVLIKIYNDAMKIERPSAKDRRLAIGKIGTKAQKAQKLLAWQPKCIYCGNVATENDHYKSAIVKGEGMIGRTLETFHNIVPSCNQCHRGGKDDAMWQNKGKGFPAIMVWWRYEADKVGTFLLKNNLRTPTHAAWAFKDYGIGEADDLYKGTVVPMTAIYQEITIFELMWRVKRDWDLALSTGQAIGLDNGAILNKFALEFHTDDVERDLILHYVRAVVNACSKALTDHIKSVLGYSLEWGAGALGRPMKTRLARQATKHGVQKEFLADQARFVRGVFAFFLKSLRGNAVTGMQYAEYMKEFKKESGVKWGVESIWQAANIFDRRAIGIADTLHKKRAKTFKGRYEGATSKVEKQDALGDFNKFMPSTMKASTTPSIGYWMPWRMQSKSKGIISLIESLKMKADAKEHHDLLTKRSNPSNSHPQNQMKLGHDKVLQQYRMLVWNDFFYHQAQLMPAALQTKVQGAINNAIARGYDEFYLGALAILKIEKKWQDERAAGAAKRAMNLAMERGDQDGAGAAAGAAAPAPAAPESVYRKTAIIAEFAGIAGIKDTDEFLDRRTGAYLKTMQTKTGYRKELLDRPGAEGLAQVPPPTNIGPGLDDPVSGTKRKSGEIGSVEQQSNYSARAEAEEIGILIWTVIAEQGKESSGQGARELINSLGLPRALILIKALEGGVADIELEEQEDRDMRALATDTDAPLQDLGDPEGKVEWDLSSLGSVEFEELSD
jgi:hypothetical protein